ncbi:MAG TPA: polysaccharide deacetylase family protein [Acidimicrobiia bacterium]|nr:polysaccharide deacetylase family protein [Acidimicrobiia bacterium]
MRAARRLVLNFHGLGNPDAGLDDELKYWLEPSYFEDLLDAVGARPDIALTFDDGNRSDVEIALPALVRRGLKGAFFPVAGRLGEPGYVDDADLRILAEAGMEIGSHGMRHRPWRNIDATAAHEELVESRERLRAAAGRPVLSAACPFGLYDRRSLTALRQAGYQTVYTSDGGDTEAGAWLQARNTVTNTSSVADVVAMTNKQPSKAESLLRIATLAVKRWR